jgi:hypothetical protein
MGLNAITFPHSSVLAHNLGCCRKVSRCLKVAGAHMRAPGISGDADRRNSRREKTERVRIGVQGIACISAQYLKNTTKSSNVCRHEEVPIQRPRIPPRPPSAAIDQPPSTHGGFLRIADFEISRTRCFSVGWCMKTSRPTLHTLHLPLAANKESGSPDEDSQVGSAQ